MQKKETGIPSIAADNLSALVNKNPVNIKARENHQQAAAHHTEAAKHHLDAAKWYEAGNLEKASHSAMLAYGHHAIAGEFMSDDAKHHAQMLKQTNYGK